MTSIASVGGPTAWAGGEIEGDDDWVFRFDDRQLGDLLRQVEELAPAHRQGGMAAVADLDRASRLDQPGEPYCAIRDQLLGGRGLALIRGLPVADVGIEQCELLTWCIGRRIGLPIHQNHQRDLIVGVRDEGRDFARHDVRAYETSARLKFHSDSSDIVGLLCVRSAQSGGVSRVVSATRIHDEMVARRPDLVPLLYEPWWHYNPATGAVHSRPICIRQGTELFTHYGRRYLDLGGSDPRTPELTDRHRRVLDTYDELTNRDDLVLDMHFQPGDLQLLNNFRILHSRTAYTDHPDPTLRRHLCRIWLVVPDRIDVPAEFEDIGIIPRTVAFQGT